jgi:hypothetical protein
VRFPGFKTRAFTGVGEVAMSSLHRRGRRAEAHDTASSIMLTQDDYSFVNKDGETVQGAGYQPVGDDGDHVFGFNDEDFDYVAQGARACKVAGVSYRHSEIQSDGFSPGRRLRLIPDPANPHDVNAIEVRTSDGKLMAGYIPREVAALIAPSFKTGGAWEAMSLWEWRTVSRGRIGIRVLMAPRLEVSGVVSQPPSSRSAA